MTGWLPWKRIAVVLVASRVVIVEEMTLGVTAAPDTVVILGVAIPPPGTVAMGVRAP